MEPENSKEAAKQPMEAEAGDPEDPRDLGNSLNPPVILLQMPNLTCKPFFFWYCSSSCNLRKLQRMLIIF
jgi:hypothetical protein